MHLFDPLNHAIMPGLAQMKKWRGYRIGAKLNNISTGSVLGHSYTTTTRFQNPNIRTQNSLKWMAGRLNYNIIQKNY
jgi:hypothetical protein